MQTNLDATILQTTRIDSSFNMPTLHQALRIAIYDEMKAYETYMQIIEKFGEVTPFINIVEAEKNHYNALIHLLEKYQVALPSNDYSSLIVLPETLLEACELGVAAEIDNIAMYDNLLEYTQDYPDVQEVFYKLQAASYNNHLPAFRRCVYAAYNQAAPEAKTQAMALNNSGLDFSNMEQTFLQLDDFSKTAQQFSKGEINQEEVLKLLGNKNISFIGGALLGAVGAMMFSQVLTKEDKTTNQKKGE
ncbi:MAG: DUF2202 domain-containing protein [Arcobacteraceae bacterium]